MFFRFASVVLTICLLLDAIAWGAACRLLVPAELLNGCIFDPMIVERNSEFDSLPGHSVTRQNCNTMVKKDLFGAQPLLYYGRARSDRTYTVMMIDPDYPHYTTGQFYLHWLVTNIPGEWLRQGLNYNVGEYIVGYTAPDPPVFSGQHRYMIFAYEQMELEIDVPQPESRVKFDPIRWMELFGGEDVLRGPVASIGFISEF